jgi:hypothetical protein
MLVEVALQLPQRNGTEIGKMGRVVFSLSGQLFPVRKAGEPLPALLSIKDRSRAGAWC